MAKTKLLVGMYGNIRSNKMIINQVVVGGGSGGNVDALMESNYKIQVVSEQNSLQFGFESDLFCQEMGVTPIDWNAWGNAGLDFWQWFLEANGFVRVDITKYFGIRVASTEGFSTDGRCMAELVAVDDTDAVVETIPGGVLETFAGNTFDESTGSYQIYCYVKDQDTGDYRSIIYKSAPDDEETTIDFCLWDPSVDGGVILGNPTIYSV